MIALALVVGLMVQEPADVTRADTPIEAAQWVAADLATLPPEIRGEVFYVWLPSWASAEWHHAIAFAANTSISRAGTVQRPDVIAGGWVQRWHLSRLVPEAELRPRIAEILREAIVEDPYFHQRETGALAKPIIDEHEDLLFALGVVDLPVMRADYALEVMLSSLDGGKYLELRGLAAIEADEDGRSPEEIVLARFGVFRDQAIAVDGDRRVGMWRSGVTFKPRIVLGLRGLAGSAWITDDVFDEDVSPDRHLIYNILSTPRRGSEIIAEMPNGFHLFLITDDAGNILTEAPANLVTDSRIAHTATARLQGGAISCVRCHGDSSGLKPCSNDVARMLSGRARVLVDSGIVDTIEAENEVATRYAGRDFERHLRNGRDDYEATIDELTGGEMTVEELSALVSDIYAQRRYALVTPERALSELGFRVDPFGPEAQRLLSAITKPLETPAEGISVVDLPDFVQLDTGGGIRRSDWDRVFQFALERVHARGLYEVKQ